MKKILIMGLPKAGKTTFAEELVNQLKKTNHVDWFNADKTREFFNDWDFTVKGRIRQAYRMRDLARISTADYVICDFIAPLAEMRDIFQADYTVWIDTLDQSVYEDTNKLFEKPMHYTIRVTEQDADKWVKIFLEEMRIDRKDV
jgi:adenylylsulfate kinase-like enzyme